MVNGAPIIEVIILIGKVKFSVKKDPIPSQSNSKMLPIKTHAGIRVK